MQETVLSSQSLDLLLQQETPGDGANNGSTSNIFYTIPGQQEISMNPDYTSILPVRNVHKPTTRNSYPNTAAGLPVHMHIFASSDTCILSHHGQADVLLRGLLLSAAAFCDNRCHVFAAQMGEKMPSFVHFEGPLSTAATSPTTPPLTNLSLTDPSHVPMQMGEKIYSFVHFEGPLPSQLYFMELAQNAVTGAMRVVQQAVSAFSAALYTLCISCLFDFSPI